MKLKYFALLLLILTTKIELHAQALKSFTPEPKKFAEEMKSFLELGIKKQSDEIMDKFLPLWEGGKFTNAQQQLIYDNCNMMLKKRLKPSPDFANYLLALCGFVENNRSAAEFTNWHKAMEKSMTLTPRRVGDFIENCYVIFAKNNLYESNSVRWTTSGSNYAFEFDSIPKLVFEKVNLICYAKNDSSFVLNTSGSFYPSLKLWRGQNGRVTWERAGMGADEAFCDLQNYNIDMTGSDYIADTVTFTYKKYFDKTLNGKLLDKILANADSLNATYPRFESYTKDISISNLIKDVEYKGGFALRGNKMIGAGDELNDAQLIFRRKDKPFFVASAQSFFITPERIASQSAAITIYWWVDSLPGVLDSIVHPGVNFKYVSKDKKITVLRDTRGAQQSPFFDSYHDVDLYAEEITWKINDPIIDMAMSTGEGESRMRIESANYYSQKRFEKLQGINDESPLYMIKKFARKYGTDYVMTEDLAKELRMQPSEVRSLLLFLSNNGFLSFDFKTDRAYIKDKLYYYLDAFSNATDYDGIIIESQIGKLPNASINLLNFDLKIRGVAGAVLSDSNNTFMVPTNQELVMKQNRNLEFGGRLHAGRIDFFGDDFKFDYSEFKIKLTDVDSMRISVPADAPNEQGRYPLIAVQNYLKGINGEIIIDSLNNKSGLKPALGYPLFTCTSNSYVYWDDASVFGGVYARDKFYFKVEPFVMDSAANLTKYNVRFEGTFVSNIFPDSKEALVVQPDYSLGFTKETPPGGLEAYGGKGTFTNKITLSNRGLQGSGSIDYLSSKTQSESIFFFPDSTVAEADAFEIRKENRGNAAYPSVNANKVLVTWVPKKDYMDITKTDKDFDLYDKQVYLDGKLRLTPAGLGGAGTAGFYDAKLLSRDFRFGQTDFGADSAGFKLNSDDPNTFAIDAQNINATINLNAKKGMFKANDAKSKVDFPVNMYTSNIEKFDWDIAQKSLQFQSALADGAGYVSTSGIQDSLNFKSPLLNYSLNDYIMRATGVKQILVADASIIPDAGLVNVEKNAKMQTLVNAVAIANTQTKYHTFVNASLDIASRKRYEGTGDYEYTDQANVKHLIHLERIGIDTSKATYAYGTVDDTASFIIAPNTLFKGQVKIRAPREKLFFDGYAQIEHQCSQTARSWFSFASEIDPKGVTIPVYEPVNETKEKLYSGFYYTTDSDGVYATFISEKRKKADFEIINAAGLLTFDNATKEYRLTPQTDSAGYISLNDDQCLLYGEGWINTGVNYGQYKLKSTGSILRNLNNDSVSASLVLDLDFMFNDKALNEMYNVITSYANLKTTNDNRPLYGNAMTKLIGKKEWEKVNAEIAQYGTPKRVPEDLRHSLILSEVNMMYNPASQSWKSSGPIGIGFIRKNALSRYAGGYCEIIRKKGGDIFNLYIEVDANTWYYFNFQRGVLQSVSSDVNFNDAIAKEKENNRYSKGKGDIPDYQYMLSTERKKNEFIKRMLGIED